MTYSQAPADARHAAAGSSLGALTLVEREVLYDAASGLTAIESASFRGKGTETIKAHRKNVLLKLGARNMPHAVAIGVHHGLIAATRR